MNALGFTTVTLVLFGAGFAGTLFLNGQFDGAAGAGAAAGVAMPVGAEPEACDPSQGDCRARLRGQGERALATGDRRLGVAAHRRAALAGDVRSQFQLGWFHEQAYLAAVGSRFETPSPVAEERVPGLDNLPRGPEFEALLGRYEGIAAGPSRPLADRSLAVLWYGRAARGGLGAAMNNLGAMYQFGALGGRDKAAASKWYKRANDAGNPVGGYNLTVIGNRRPAGDCSEGPVFGILGGSRASPIDLEDEILTRSRFRGRMLDPALANMLQVQSRLPPDRTMPLREIDLVAASVDGGLLRLKAMGEALGAGAYDENVEMADAVSASTTPSDCDGPTRRRSSESDRDKLERVRAMQNQMARPPIRR